MRSIRFTSLLLSLSSAATLALAAVAGGGCQSAMSRDSSFEGSPTSPGDVEPPTANANPSAQFGNDAGEATTFKGNALCRIAINGNDPTCDPDDDGRTFPKRLKAAPQCSGTLPDAGSAADPDAGAADESFEGCRLASNGGFDIVPTCASSSAAGTDGASCNSGADCAPGFDCVDGEKSPVCRHYCCSGTCDGKTSQSAGPTFCDVQRVVDIARIAPMCMPLKRCKLMDEGTCAATETCAVVTESGDTGCVALGQATAGSSCEDTHCAANLTCLGQTRNRKCYELCKVNSESCGSGQTCKTSALFKNPEFGVCEKL